PLEVVTAGVVGARELAVEERRLARRPALVAHRLDHPPAAFPHQHRRIHAGEDAAVARLRAGAAQVRELAQRPVDLRGGYAPVLQGLLRGLRLQRALGIGEALLLLEDLLLQLAGRLCVMRVDQCLDLALPVAGRGQERGIHALGDLSAAAAGAVDVQAHEGGDVDVGTEGPDVALVAGFDLGGVAHGCSLPRPQATGNDAPHYRLLSRMNVLLYAQDRTNMLETD